MSIDKTVDFDFLDRSVMTNAEEEEIKEYAIPYTIIHIPDMNDSMSRVMLKDTPHYLRMQYLDTPGRWMFSLYDIYRKPVILGIKIVPNFCLNLYYGRDDIPFGVFMAFSRKTEITRKSFEENEARFIFIPVLEENDNYSASNAVRITDISDET